MYFPLKLINRLCRNRCVSALPQTDSGIKWINPVFSNDVLARISGSELGALPVQELYLAVDGLKDQYTLINTRVIDSPHYELMEVLAKGSNPIGCDYIKRAAASTLDFRLPQRINNTYLSLLREKYRQAVESIDADNYEPIRVTLVDGRYYIADGKHRAALCALKGVSPRCIDVSPILYDSFFCWIYKRMLEYRQHYEKHISFFEAVLKES